MGTTFQSQMRGLETTGLAHKNALAFLHSEMKEQALMVKRRKEEDIAGVLEFEGRTAQDPEFMDWVADHRKQNGGKIRVSKGWKGVRVVFAKEADLTLWKTRFPRSVVPLAVTPTTLS